MGVKKGACCYEVKSSGMKSENLTGTSKSVVDILRSVWPTSGGGKFYCSTPEYLSKMPGFGFDPNSLSVDLPLRFSG